MNMSASQTNLFSSEFYPTPDNIAWKMVGHYAHKFGYGKPNMGKPILDPSAGNGAILDVVKRIDSFSKSHKHLYGIEIDFELRAILKEKGHKVIGTDFMQYSEPMKFALIAMNPPFSEGAKHVLRAWDMVDDGGDLVALLNAETLNNPYTKERQLLGKLIAQYGDGEEAVTQLGQCFKDSARSTNVDVVMIRLTKPVIQSTNLFEGMGLEQDTGVSEEAFAENPLAHTNQIKNLVIQYQLCVKALTARHDAQSKLDFYSKDISGTVYESIDRNKEECLNQEASLAEQIATLKSRFWNTVFCRTKLEKRSTSDFRKKFHEFAIQQSNMAFTEENIVEVLAMFFANKEQILLDAIYAVFDKATKYDSKNTIHTEGWKTNSAHKINKRVIIPCAFYWTSYGMWSEYYHGNIDDFLDDLDKVMCHISGRLPEDPDLIWAYRACKDKCHSGHTGGATPFESTFFRMKMFKKGTLHIEFKDLKLLEDLNKQAAQGRNWIGRS